LVLGRSPRRPLDVTLSSCISEYCYEHTLLMVSHYPAIKQVEAHSNTRIEALASGRIDISPRVGVTHLIR
jgi:hypothetical protein